MPHKVRVFAKAASEAERAGKPPPPERGRPGTPDRDDCLAGYYMSIALATEAKQAEIVKTMACAYKELGHSITTQNLRDTLKRINVEDVMRWYRAQHGVAWNNTRLTLNCLIGRYCVRRDFIPRHIVVVDGVGRLRCRLRLR